MMSRMTLKLWEIVAGFLGLAFAAIFLLSNVSGLGFALLAADLLWIVTRLEITEDHDEAGHYTTLKGRLGVLRLGLLVSIYGSAVYGFFIIQHDLGVRARATVVAEFAIAGLWFMLLTEVRRSGDDTLHWIKGARAERAVGTKLNQFKQRGWLVLHGYKKDRGGDIDHILCGPQGAYIIETKSYGYRSRDTHQTAINAWWLREKLGVRWVTGVLCVDGTRNPERRGKIWVVAHDDLVEWLARQHNNPVDLASARERLLPSEGGAAQTAIWPT